MRVSISSGDVLPLTLRHRRVNLFERITTRGACGRNERVVAGFSLRGLKSATTMFDAHESDWVGKIQAIAAMIFAILLWGNVLMAQNLPEEENRLGVGDGGTASTLRRSEDILTKVMELLDAENLDCLNCTWKAAVAVQGGDVLQIEARGADLPRIRNFFQKLSENWNWDLQSFTAKPALSDASEPRIQFSCELSLLPGHGQDPAHVTPIFQILGQMPFFAMSGKTPTVPNLFGCIFERGKSPSFQIIAPVLDQLLQVVSSGNFPGRSRSLSKSVYLGTDLFTLDFTDQSDGLPVPDIIALFKTVAGAAGLREITVPRGPEKSALVQATIDLTASQWIPVGEIFSAGFGYDLLKVDGKGETANPAGSDPWTCVILLGKGSGRGFPGTAIGTILGAAWPAALKPGLRFTWLPTSFRLSAQVGGEPDADVLRRIAEPIGFSYLGPQSRESLDANAMIIAFSHGQQALALGNQLTTGATKRVGEIVDHAVTPDGPRISVKLLFSEIPALIDQLREERACISQMTLDCHPPDQPVLAYIQTEGNDVQSRRIFRLTELLVRAPFPWDRPLEDIGKGLILDGFTITGGEEFQVRGSTLKSRQIFSDLFQLLPKVAGVNTPFFREGKYSDYRGGRLMRFVVTARWSEPEKQE